MVELLIPLGRIFQRDKNVPLALQGLVHGAPLGAQELAYSLGGRDKKPRKPVFLYGPHGEPIMLVGAGEAEAAELEDLAQEAEARAAMDFASKRERYGYAPREQVDSLFRNALRDRIKRHQQNPVSDPFRIPGKRRQ